MISPVWNDKYYVRVFQLARDGMSDEEIAKSMGVDLKTFKSWRKERPALSESLRQGRSAGARYVSVDHGLEGLELRQRIFVHEFLVDLNASAAAKRAGYSPKTAHVTAIKILKKPLVQEAIFRAMQERVHRTDIEADRVLQELACIAFIDPKNLFNDEGVLREIVEMGGEVRRSISSFEVSSDGRVKVKFSDKVRALELLMKHLGMIQSSKALGDLHEHQHLHLEHHENPYEEVSDDSLIEAKVILEGLKKKVRGKDETDNRDA